MLWSIVSFPFRVLGWIVGLVGRLVGAILGFVVMVVGVAFCTGGVVLLGVPLFIVGLILTLKSLG